MDGHLERYSLAHEDAWFVPLNWVKRDIATYRDDHGKIRRRNLAGHSRARGVYWHFAVSAVPRTGTPQRLVLRPHVIFTHDGITPLESKRRAAVLRRSFCKNWWNDRWRDMLRAFVSSISRQSNTLELRLGGDNVATVETMPVRFTAPLSLHEDRLPSPMGPQHHLEVTSHASAHRDGSGSTVDGGGDIQSVHDGDGERMP